MYSNFGPSRERTMPLVLLGILLLSIGALLLRCCYNVILKGKAVEGLLLGFAGAISVGYGLGLFYMLLLAHIATKTL